MLRRLPLALLAACNSPSPAPPRPASPVPAASSISPVPEDSSKPPVPAASSVPPVPAASSILPVPEAIPTPPLRADTPGGPLTLHLAAVSDEPVVIVPLVDGGVALRSDLALAIAPASGGPPVRDPAWPRGLPIVAGEGRPDRLEFGGRWPDAAFFSFSRDYARTGVHHAALRWQTERWVDQARGEPEEGVLASFITAFAGGPDGAVFGLRSPRYIAQDPEEADLHAQEQALARARPVVERLDREQPPAWPALPAGPPADDLLGFPDGTLVVLRAGPRLQQWRPGASAWTSLPAVGYAAADTPVTLVGRDPARLYLHACPGARPRAHQHADGTWRPLRLPDTTCVRALAEAPDGALWLVSAGGLYRHPAPAPVQGVAAAWEKIVLPTVPLPARPAAWRHNGDMFEWNEFPAVPAAAPTPEPDQVVVLASGELWLAASVGASRFGFAARGRSVVLTTRPVAAAVVLPDPMLLAAEASLLDEPAVGPASDCRTLHLQLGATSDAPASARPPALTDDRLGDLRVVTTAVGTRHDLAVLWLRGAPEPADAYTRLAALVEPLRPSYPALRLRCSLPTITGLLP